MVTKKPDLFDKYNAYQTEFAKADNFEPHIRQDNISSALFNYSGDGISKVRYPTDRRVYDAARPNEAVPCAITQEDQHHVMLACKAIYQRVGIVRTVIDLMSEMASEGVEIVHEDAGPNQFYKEWFRKINGQERVERALSWIFKNGNFVVRRTYGTIKANEVRQMRRVSGQATAANVRIPMQYTLYDPASIDLIGDQLGTLSEVKNYAVRIPMSNFNGLRTPRNALEKQAFEALPQEIKDAMQGKAAEGYYYVPIPSDKIWVGHFKKDDSDIWATSFLYAILSDVYYNDKLKLAKTSALDGMINVVRLWKLGDIKNGIMPSPAMGAKLASILENNVGGGAVDIIWTSDIELEEAYPPIDKLVGFAENTDIILAGLGIPRVLLGGSQTGTEPAVNGSTLQNFISRLTGGRNLINQWLNAEIDIIQEEMGFKKRPIIRYSNDSFYNEQTYFKLLIDLVDRNVISNDRVLEVLKDNPNFEKIRLQRQEQERKDGALPPKAGPFNNPQLPDQQQHELTKITKQGQTDIKVQEAAPNSSNLSKDKGTPSSQKGRPPGTKDTVKRQRSKAIFGKYLGKAAALYDNVDSFVTKLMLAHFNVATARQLTNEQKKEIEAAKDYLYPRINPFIEFNNDVVTAAYQSNDNPGLLYQDNLQISLGGFAAEHLSSDTMRLLRIQSYVDAWLDFEDNDKNENK